MTERTCQRRALSVGRRIICDGFAFASGDHASAGERTMRLADVVAAREAARPRPNWCAIMLKAFAIAAARHPEMRQIYVGFPWGHLCEFNTQVASVAIGRKVEGEDAVLFAPIYSPENQSLQAIDGHLRHYAEVPLEEVSAFRNAIRTARMPWLLRRFLWWYGLNVQLRERPCRFGTYMVTTMSPFGAKTTTLPTLGHPILHYGVFSDAGEIPVSLVIDHRVMDGAVVGYTLLEMEQALHHDIVAELRGMAETSVAA